MNTPLHNPFPEPHTVFSVYPPADWIGKVDYESLSHPTCKALLRQLEYLLLHGFEISKDTASEDSDEPVWAEHGEFAPTTNGLILRYHVPKEMVDKFKPA